MNKKGERLLISISIAIAVVVLLIIFLFSPIFGQIYKMYFYQNNSKVIDTNEIKKENIIEMSTLGFSPSIIRIISGEKVIFIAVDDASRWPASEFHPTHNNYPESDIDKCGTSDEVFIFDSCEEINKGNNYSFQFDSVGNWIYHDHLQPEKKGLIIVE